MSFQTAVSGWHDFYILAGTAAATLVGPLFVGLSLHLRVVIASPEVRSLARVTLANFGAMLFVALTLQMRPRDRARLLLRFGLSVASYLAITVAGVLLFSSLQAFTWLVVATFVLLVVSLRNTWDLLVTVGDVTLGRD